MSCRAVAGFRSRIGTEYMTFEADKSSHLCLLNPITGSIFRMLSDDGHVVDTGTRKTLKEKPKMG
jgi:hypothetical protein